MTILTRTYLRASTSEQDSQRAKADLVAFAVEHGLTIAHHYPENESGASLARPELFKLLGDSNPGDILLCEQVDRLSRLSGPDWETLRTKIQEKRVRVVSLDLPSSWQFMKSGGDETAQRIMEALNSMMLDMLAAYARKDYTDRRRRTAQGIAKAKDAGRYAGRPANEERNKNIIDMLAKDMSWSQVCEITGASRSTLARLVKEQKASAVEGV